MQPVAGTTPQTAVVSTAVPIAPAVRVLDANGAGVSGVVVTFTVASGGGTVVGGTATSNASGIATVTSWTLGSTVGTNTLTASVTGVASVTFTATGTVGAPTQLTKSSTDPQTATVHTAVAAPPAVLVRDAGNNPVPGVSVTFTVTTGGGSITGGTATTNALGIATVGSWTLGNTAGSNTLTASSTGLPSAVFTATGTPGPAATLTVTPSPVMIQPAATQQLTVVAVDQFGNVIASPAVTYTPANTAIATASATGLVTGGAVGSTNLTVTSGTATQNVFIVVGFHPAGTVIVNTPEGGRPFAVAISSLNVVYAGEQDNSRLGRYDLPALTLNTFAAVGSVPTDVSFLPNGTKAYVTNQFSGNVGVVDVATNTQTTTIPVSGSAFRVLAAPNGTTVYATTATGNLYVINTATNTATTVAIGGILNGIALHPTLPILYLSSTGGTVYEVSTTTNTVSRSFAMGGTPQELILSADGTKLFVANESGALEVRNTTTLAQITTVAAAALGFGGALSRDGLQLYISIPSASKVVVLDAATYAVLNTITGGSPRRIAFDKTGQTAAIGNEAGYVTFVR